MSLFKIEGLAVLIIKVQLKTVFGKSQTLGNGKQHFRFHIRPPDHNDFSGFIDLIKRLTLKQVFHAKHFKESFQFAGAVQHGQRSR